MCVCAPSKLIKASETKQRKNNQAIETIDGWMKNLKQFFDQLKLENCSIPTLYQKKTQNTHTHTYIRLQNSVISKQEQQQQQRQKLQFIPPKKVDCVVFVFFSRDKLNWIKDRWIDRWTVAGHKRCLEYKKKVSYRPFYQPSVSSSVFFFYLENFISFDSRFRRDLKH